MIKDRRAARRLALHALYQAEIRDQLPVASLALMRRDGWTLTQPFDEGSGEVPSEDAVAYATALVAGVEAHAATIDGLIDRNAERWTIDRMPIVDRNLLRLATFELLWEPDVPTAVVINEAIELANSFSTEESGRFINGLLGRLAEIREESATDQ